MHLILTLLTMGVKQSKQIQEVEIPQNKPLFEVGFVRNTAFIKDNAVFLINYTVTCDGMIVFSTCGKIYLFQMRMPREFLSQNRVHCLFFETMKQIVFAELDIGTYALGIEDIPDGIFSHDMHFVRKWWGIGFNVNVLPGHLELS